MPTAVLPHNAQYERSILSLLLDPTVSESDKGEVFDFLRVSDFYDIRHRETFKACSALHRDKKPLDLVTVASVLEGKFSNPGSYVSDIAGELPATDVVHYTDVVRNYSMARTAIQTLVRRLDELRSLKGDSINSIGLVLDEVQDEILQISDPGKANFCEMPDLLSGAIEEYKQLNAGTKDAWVRTGFSLLDDVISVRGSKLIVIAARPGVGKSSFAISAMRNMLKAGQTVALFELEMDRADVVSRLVSQEADINLMHLTYGSGPGPAVWEDIMRAGGAIHSWQALVDDEGGLAIHELKRRIRLAKKQGAQCIFIDQLSQIRGEGKTEYERNTNILQELSKLKKQIRIPIFLLAQINRKSEEKGNSGPALHMLKSTGALEEEADIVLLIDRPFLRTLSPSDRDKAIIEVAKNRNGATGKIELQWVGSRAMFREPQ